MSLVIQFGLRDVEKITITKYRLPRVFFIYNWIAFRTNFIPNLSFTYWNEKKSIGYKWFKSFNLFPRCLNSTTPSSLPCHSSRLITIRIKHGRKPSVTFPPSLISTFPFTLLSRPWLIYSCHCSFLLPFHILHCRAISEPHPPTYNIFFSLPSIPGR